MKLAELEIIVVNLQAKVVELETKINTLSVKKGPASTREMTVEDAEKILTGEHKELSHKIAAEKLGLSYGQIYSCRGGYTFKNIARK
jgi:hypothetical protein